MYTSNTGSLYHNVQKTKLEKNLKLNALILIKLLCAQMVAAVALLNESFE